MTLTMLHRRDPRRPSTQTPIGICVQSPHAPAMLASASPLAFVSVADTSELWVEPLSQLYPVHLQADWLTIGTAHGPASAQLDKLQAQLAAIEVERVTVALDASCICHPPDLAWQPVLTQLSDLRQRLQQPILLDASPVWHAGWAPADQAEILVHLCQRSGCQLQLDLHALLVQGLNRARQQGWTLASGHADTLRALGMARAEALDLIWGLPPSLVGEVRLGGFLWPAAPDEDITPERNQRLTPTAWSLYEEALEHLGAIPTLIDWNHQLPPLAVLLDEARLAAQYLGEQHDCEQTELFN